MICSTKALENFLRSFVNNRRADLGIIYHDNCFLEHSSSILDDCDHLWNGLSKALKAEANLHLSVYNTDVQEIQVALSKKPLDVDDQYYLNNLKFIEYYLDNELYEEAAGQATAVGLNIEQISEKEPKWRVRFESI